MPIDRALSPECRALITRLIEFDNKYPTALEPEMLDFLDVVEMGKLKHPDPPEGARANWLLEDGNTASHRDMHDKMFHHLARSFSNTERPDQESQLDHLLHVSCRAIMAYIRIKRNIRHIEDKE